MIFNRFTPSRLVLTVGLSLFSSLQAALNVEDRDPTSFLIPLTQCLTCLERDLTIPEFDQLQTLAHHLQTELPPKTIDDIMVLGSQYLQHVKVLLPPGDDEGVHPSIEEVIGILHLLANMEKAHPDKPSVASHFSYGSLENYFPLSSFEDQTYYLNLFYNLLVKSHFDETMADQIIDYSRLFMRSSHTADECTQIATTISDYMLDHPDEDYKGDGPLRDAETDRSRWDNEDVTTQLQRYLRDVYTDNESEEESEPDVLDDHRPETPEEDEKIFR